MRTRIALCLAVTLAIATVSGCIRITVPGGDSRSGQTPQTPTPTVQTQTQQPATTPPQTQPTSPTKKVPAQPPQQSESSSPHHPGFYSAERKAICNALRVPVQRDLEQPVVFVVDKISVQDGWAFIVTRPVKPDGGEIDYSSTRYADQVADGAFEDDAIALLRNDGSGWRVVTWNIGATDVVWSPWAETYGAPRAIFQ